jgi:PPK2 family polyphosphate:nucleotide phosphotransferase
MKKDYRALASPYVVTDGKRFRLKDHRPKGPGRRAAKHETKKFLKAGIKVLGDLQEKLYAQDRWGVLLIFQAMDASGKDSAIKAVMSGIDPKGCQVYSFKSPSSEELDHDFMWRTSKSVPERGRIGVFNRSYYEEVLIVRVHPTILGCQRLPPEAITKRIWNERFEDINAFERYLTRNGYVIRKFFLNISRGEQRRRFQARLDRPEKNWKFEMGDLAERGRWRKYMAAYEETIRRTATPHAPWVVIPSDDKKFARTIIAAAIIDAIAGLRLKFPALDAEQKRDLGRARRLLNQEARRAKP